MSLAKSARFFTGTTLVFVLLSQPVSAQTSIGFADPEDISTLLEYRLPDWGYRSWDLGFNLGGSGGDSYFSDEQQTAYNNFLTELSTLFNFYRESEQRIYRVSSYGRGSYLNSRRSHQDMEESGHDLGGHLDLGGNWVQYLGEGPLSLRAGGRTNLDYGESIRENRDGQVTEEVRQFSRGQRYVVDLGAGLGRVRDVTPLIRAQRLSERLTALGRKALTPYQVQKIAHVLASEYGYRGVYDRPEKDFWRDVLQPMLNPDNPLSPYEIYYLREIMEEDVGPRREGVELQAGFFYRDFDNNYDPNGTHDIERGPALVFLWAKNLSLDHQVSLGVDGDYSWSSSQRYGANIANAGLNLAYLWTIADRYRWDTDLTLDAYYREFDDGRDSGIQRSLSTRLDSEFTIFIEDTISMNFRVRGSNLQENVSSSFDAYYERYSRRWNWSYGIGLTYLLDGVLY